MVNMNHLEAALHSLLFLCTVVAGEYPEVHKDEVVSYGDSVTFTCNSSKTNTTQITWTKGNFHLLYSPPHTPSSNFTSDRVKIDTNLPSKLSISKAEPEDEGLYKCAATDDKGPWTYMWNLTVSTKPEEIHQSGFFPFFLYILLPVIGISLCSLCSILSIYLWRKSKAETPNQTSVPDQSQLESAGEQSVADRRTNRRRHQYMERFNSIYDSYAADRTV